MTKNTRNFSSNVILYRLEKIFLILLSILQSHSTNFYKF